MDGGEEGQELLSQKDPFLRETKVRVGKEGLFAIALIL